MSLNSRIYRAGLSAVTGANIVVTIDDLDTLMRDDSCAILDIYSWASDANTPDNILEFSSFLYKQLLIKKASGVITIQDSKRIQENTTATGGTSISWSEAMNGTDIELSVTIAGVDANVFRRATIKMIQA